MIFTVVIPARYASTRLPGKPLADVGGKPMILHVWERAREAGASQVVVATDDERIRDACTAHGAEVVMTSASHASGTDRINEAVNVLGLADDAIVVNVQGDEPLMPSENIRQVAELVAVSRSDLATLHVPITSVDEFLDPNVVKLVNDRDGRAIYFSRAPIPWPRDSELDAGKPVFFQGAVRHLGIYAYRVHALRRFSAAQPSALEDIEKLEQLRALWLGMAIRTAVAARTPPRGVDTADDLETLRRQLTETQRE